MFDTSDDHIAEYDNTSAPDTEAHHKAPPATPAELHDWIQKHLGITVLRTPLIPGHSAPFDYICHSFFEGGNSWPPTPPRISADAATTPADCIIWANRGGGKTFMGALATVLDLVFKPGIQIRILAGSLDQGQRMHEHLRSLFSKPALANELAGRITERRIRLRNNSQVAILAASQTSVRGTRVQKLRCDEVDLFDRSLWEAAQLTTRSARCGEAYIRGTIEALSTMQNPYGLMFDLVRQAGEGKRRLFKWGLLDIVETCEHRQCDNPAGTEVDAARPCALLGECGGAAKPTEHGGKRDEQEGHIEVDDAVRQKSRVPLPVWESEMLCLRASRADSVFPDFDPKVHVVNREPAQAEIVHWVGGMDFGFRAPTVVLWAALDHAARLWIVDERIVREAVVTEHIEAIRKSRWPKFAWIGIDPAGKQCSDQTGTSNAGLLRREGFAIRTRSDAILRGLLAIRARLSPADRSAPRLLIHERCAGLIEAMHRYRYDPSRPESDQPLKEGPDHAVDALRYMVMNLDHGSTARVQTY